MIVMRGFIEIVSPSSLFLGTVLSRVECASAGAKGLPAGKLVCPGGDLLDRNSIPSKAVRSDPRLRTLPQARRCLKERGDGWVSNTVLICFPLLTVEIRPAEIRPVITPDLRKAFEESWQRNKPGYRYLTEH